MYTLKKSLGQHFLRDESVSRHIVEELRLYPFERLLEVGPGGGALTKYLLEFDNVDFRAVELDREKVAFLEKEFPRIQGKLVNESILDIEAPFDQSFTLVGNFPYNISTQIVFRVIEWKDLVETMLGMFQKEVAQRIAASEGSKIYGVTSVLTQAFFQVDYLFEVPESAFNPPPKVKSAVIRLRPLTNPPEIRSEKALFNLVKTAFGQRRKTLRNAVKALFDAETLQDPIFNKRAEQLSVNDFAALTFKMQS